MKTERGRAPLRRAIGRVSEQSRGVLRPYIGMAAMRMAEIHIADVSKLPVEEGTFALENASGQNLFLAGYSQVGGPDVVG